MSRHLPCPVCGYDHSRDPFRTPSLAQIAKVSAVFERTEMTVRPKAEWDRLEAELASLRRELETLREENRRLQNCFAVQKSSPTTVKTPSLSAPPKKAQWQLEPDGLKLAVYASSPETVLVPSQINGQPVTRLGHFALHQQQALRRVVIPEGVASLGAWSLAENPNLEAVELPASLKKIWRHAFSRNGALRSIDLPEGLEELGENAFSFCRQLETIRLPSALKKLGQHCFEGCDNLRAVVFPRSWENREQEIEAAGIDFGKVQFRA